MATGQSELTNAYQSLVFTQALLARKWHIERPFMRLFKPVVPEGISWDSSYYARMDFERYFIHGSVAHVAESALVPEGVAGDLKGHLNFSVVKSLVGITYMADSLRQFKGGEMSSIEALAKKNPKAVYERIKKQINAKIGALLDQTSFVLIHGDIFDYDDDGTTHGWGVGGANLVSADGVFGRGCKAFAHFDAGETQTIPNYDRDINNAVSIILNDHTDGNQAGIGANNYGNRGAFFLKRGEILAVYDGPTSAANVVGYVIVMGIKLPDATGDGLFAPYEILVQKAPGYTAAMTLGDAGAATNYYFVPADYYSTSDGWGDWWFKSPVGAAYAAEQSGYLHNIDRANDPDFVGNTAEYSTGGSLRDTIQALIDRMTLEQGVDPASITISMHSRYFEFLKEEMAGELNLNVDYGKMPALDAYGPYVPKMSFNGAVVVVDNYVGPGRVLVSSTTRGSFDDADAMQFLYRPAYSNVIGPSLPGDVITSKSGIKVPNMFGWGDKPDPVFEPLAKVPQSEQYANYLVSVWGGLFPNPGRLGKVFNINI